MTAAARHHRTFGRPSAPHTVIIARGDRVRHFTVRSHTVLLSMAVALSVTLGSVGAAGYLWRGRSAPSEAAQGDATRQDYEARIASLRIQLDRAVSRQMLDRQSVETKVDVLLDQQIELAARYDKLKPLIERARESGLLAHVPVPEAQPPEESPALTSASSLNGGAEAGTALGALAFAGVAASSSPKLARFGLIDRTAGVSSTRTAKPAISLDVIRDIGQSMDSIEDRQIDGLEALAATARARADGIATVLRSEGIALEATPVPQGQGTGGPFVPVPPTLRFQAGYEDLGAALDQLQSLRQSASELPLGAPVAAVGVSSTFGVRPDPFLGRSALHTGIDLVARSGTSVTVSAPGKVVSAGASGGYGLMVEVDHGGGLVTRYAHLSSILVAVGAHVAPGDPIGLVGSTGRSTGPHLHYEVREDGTAIDPARYLRAGRKIRTIL